MKPTSPEDRDESSDRDERPATPQLAFGLVRSEQGGLTLIDAEGRRHERVRLVRAFPLTHPDGWISISDEAGELAFVEDLQFLSEPLRRAILDELADSDFMPIVTRIERVTRDAEASRWEIETDRGPTTVELEDEEAVRRLEGRAALLVDAHGVRYFIPDTAALDPRSRRWIERFL